MEDNRCHVLMEEYQLLRQKIEAIELAPNMTLEQLADFGVTESDLKRIKELEQALDKSCQAEFPKYQRIDLGPGLDNGYFSNLDQ